MAVDDELRARIGSMVEQIEEHDDVQNVWTNIA